MENVFSFKLVKRYIFFHLHCNAHNINIRNKGQVCCAPGNNFLKHLFNSASWLSN